MTLDCRDFVLHLNTMLDWTIGSLGSLELCDKDFPGRVF